MVCTRESNCSTKKTCEGVICPDEPCAGTKYIPFGECCPVCRPDEPTTTPSSVYDEELTAYSGPRVSCNSCIATFG